MTPLVLACAFGASVALALWGLAPDLRRRFQQDVAWLRYSVWRITPEPIPAERYVLLFYLAAGLLLLLFVAFAPSLPVALMLWLVLVVGPRLWMAQAWARRRKLVDEQLPAAVRQMSSGVGSGLSLAQAIERLAVRAPDPIRVEFQIMSNYWRMGADFISTIEEAKRRLDLANFNLFGSALIVNQRMGGNVTETLDRLAGALESIAKMRKEVHAATSEGRMNIKVLAVAPFLMLALILLMDAEAVGMLFQRALGHVLLGVAAMLTVVGTWWAWKIVAADV